MLYHVKLLVKTTMTLPIEAADEDEAKEIAMEMPVDEISDTVKIEDMVIERQIVEVSETAPVDDDDFGEGLYCDRPLSLLDDGEGGIYDDR